MYTYDRKIERLCSLILEEEEEVYGIKNTHDKLIKTILSNKKEFCYFVNHFISKQKKITSNEIEIANSSFITSGYNVKEADLIYRTKDNKIYYLIEHQSTVDEEMVYRMLNYTISILNYVIDEKQIQRKDYKIPQVIPIVFYTGERKWNAPQTLKNKQETIIKSKGRLEFQYLLIDHHNYTEETLLKMNHGITYAMLIEKNRGKDNLIRILEKIAQICKTEEMIISMKSIIQILLSPVLGKEKAKQLASKYKKEGGEVAMTAVDYLIQEMEQDRKDSRKEGRKDIITTMLKKGASIETISKYTGITKKEIEEITKE